MLSEEIERNDGVQAGLAEMDLGGLPSLAKAVVRKQSREQAEILSRQREWAERGARALAAAEDMPDDLGHPARYLTASPVHHAPKASYLCERVGVNTLFEAAQNIPWCPSPALNP